MSSLSSAQHVCGGAAWVQL